MEEQNVVSIDMPSKSFLTTKLRPCEETPIFMQNLCATLLLFALALALGLGMFALHMRQSFLDQDGPVFFLKSASVSSLNFSSTDSQEIMSTSEWLLKFHVGCDCYRTSLLYQSINVSLTSSTGTSTTAVVTPPIYYDANNNLDCWPTKYMNATVRVLLPSFNASYTELPFDVRVRAQLKYKNWLHIYPKKHPSGVTNAVCKGMRIRIDPYQLSGTLIGGPYTCFDG